MSIIVGKVYADWCGYCTQLAPEWEKLKLMLPTTTFVEIEQSNEKYMAEFKAKHPTLKVSGFPTIFKIGHNNKIEYYTGSDRRAPALKRWVQSSLKRHAGKRKGITNKRRFRKNKTVKSFFGFF